MHANEMKLMSKRKLKIILSGTLIIFAAIASVCWFSRERISAVLFESADRRYREIGRHPGGFDGESCSEYADGLLFKYRAALFFNKRNYGAVWGLLDTLEGCKEKKVLIDETTRMFVDEQNDAYYLEAIYIYQLVNGEKESAIKTLQRINTINGVFAEDRQFCNMLTFAYLDAGYKEKADANLDKCCKLAKAGHGDVKQACERDADRYFRSIFPFAGPSSVK